MKNIPKPALAGIAVVLIVIALAVIFHTVGGGGENSAYGSKEDIMRREAAGKGQQDQSRPTGPTTPNGGSPAAEHMSGSYGSPKH